MRNKKLLTLCECAMMIALSIVLDFLPLPKWPQGGSVSVSMIPIIFLSYRHGSGWGMFSGFVIAVFQMLTGWYAPPAGTLGAFVICVLLDYVIAFTVIGAADFFRRPFAKINRLVGYGAGALIVCILRFLCSFLSGMLIWETGWWASLTYNGGYMLPNAAIAAVVIVLLAAVIDPKTLRPAARKGNSR